MRLTAIHANRHIFKEQPSGKPIRLLLRFADSRSLRIGVAGDGLRAMIDRLPLDPPFDMAEYGQVDVADVSNLFGAHLRGADVASLHALTLDGHEIGLQVRFDANASLNVWVDGDELHWGDSEALAAHDWLDDEAPIAGLPIAL